MLPPGQTDFELACVRQLPLADGGVVTNIMYEANVMPTEAELLAIPKIKRAQIKLIEMIGKIAVISIVYQIRGPVCLYLYS